MYPVGYGTVMSRVARSDETTSSDGDSWDRVYARSKMLLSIQMRRKEEPQHYLSQAIFINTLTNSRICYASGGERLLFSHYFEHTHTKTRDKTHTQARYNKRSQAVAFLYK